MTTYSTITDGNNASSGGARDMSRTRRRGGKDGGHGGQATTISSIVNLLNTIVGAGTLAMPSVLSHMGIMLGVVLVLWSGVTAAFGLYLQSKCARYLDRGTSSFFALSQITYPNASVIFDLAIAVKCFGVGVSYMIIIGDLMPGVMLGFNDRAADIPYLVDRHFWITAFMLLIIPLSFLRRLDSLKYTSIVALVSIGYLIVLVIYHFAADPHADPSDIRVIKWAGAVETLSALPVVVFAYTCHQNMFSIINEIKNNSPASMVRVVTSSIGSAACIYLVVAITGYITFGNAIVGNIVSMCKDSAWPIIVSPLLTPRRSYWGSLDHRQGSHCCPCPLFDPSTSPSMPRLPRCRCQVAAEPQQLRSRQARLSLAEPRVGATRRSWDDGAHVRYSFCPSYHCHLDTRLLYRALCEQS
ncbi:hypothetical protein JDV02_000434 [Purpureocillium takamizusanense]|uniref:Amino acid transporter transmembrane domain-containing protein n=1 Tax=Purpureocillium takamizusanense TaxID=2060973 RepID=A0A9Q8Q795_9HYPO|nr:uncharacterized protein JDV02_000434 [Purpureocillium takamizusanense]UNI13717.1 hypothetical protein JDV02_000434 [Purpureocillium takamizusanense]